MMSAPIFNTSDLLGDKNLGNNDLRIKVEELGASIDELKGIIMPITTALNKMTNQTTSSNNIDQIYAAMKIFATKSSGFAQEKDDQTRYSSDYFINDVMNNKFQQYLKTFEDMDDEELDYMLSEGMFKEMADDLWKGTVKKIDTQIKLMYPEQNESDELQATTSTQISQVASLFKPLFCVALQMAKIIAVVAWCFPRVLKVACDTKAVSNVDDFKSALADVRAKLKGEGLMKDSDVESKASATETSLESDESDVKSKASAIKKSLADVTSKLTQLEKDPAVSQQHQEVLTKMNEFMQTLTKGPGESINLKELDKLTQSLIIQPREPRTEQGLSMG